MIKIIIVKQETKWPNHKCYRNKQKQKLETEFQDINWKTTYISAIYCAVDTKLQFFHNKYLMRILSSNKYLLKIELLTLVYATVAWT